MKKLLLLWVPMLFLVRLSGSELKGKSPDIIPIEYQGKTGYFVQRDFIEDYLNLDYENIRLKEIIELYKQKDTNYKSFLDGQSKQLADIKKVILHNKILRVSTEVISISFIGVTIGFIFYAFLNK